MSIEARLCRRRAALPSAVALALVASPAAAGTSPPVIDRILHELSLKTKATVQTAPGESTRIEVDERFVIDVCSEGSAGPDARLVLDLGCNDLGDGVISIQEGDVFTPIGALVSQGSPVYESRGSRAKSVLYLADAQISCLNEGPSLELALLGEARLGLAPIDGDDCVDAGRIKLRGSSASTEVDLSPAEAVVDRGKIRIGEAEILYQEPAP